MLNFKIFLALIGLFWNKKCSLAKLASPVYATVSIALSIPSHNSCLDHDTFPQKRRHKNRTKKPSLW